MFMQNEPTQRKTISDIIMEKLREQELQASKPGSRSSDVESAPRLHPKVVQVYKGYARSGVLIGSTEPNLLPHRVGKVLSHYTAGKVPKAFKIIPSLNNWEEVVRHRPLQDVSLSNLPLRCTSLIQQTGHCLLTMLQLAFSLPT